MPPSRASRANTKAATARSQAQATAASRPTAVATVYVVDDNGGVRRGLRALLESAGLTAETFASAEEFLAAYPPGAPGCLVLDVRLRHGSGLDLQDELRRRRVALPIIVLTGYGDVQTSVRALKAGAFDFLQKPAPPALLLERIGAALAADRQARSATKARAAVSERLARLTPREREAMDLLVGGKTSKQIALAMHVSVRTAEGHRRMVLHKLDVSSAAQLVRAVLSGRAVAPAT